MANEHLSAQRLEDSTPVSNFSGVKDLPEVRDVMGWLSGKYNSNNDFRDQALDTVVAPRQDIPDWGKDLGRERTLGEKVAKTVFYSKGGDDMNKVGEFFYSVKDGFARAMDSIPLNVLNYAAAGVKRADADNETASAVMQVISDARKSATFEKDLRDFRLGVESNALSNQFGEMIGQMGSLIALGGLAGGGRAGAIVASAGEGLAEGGQFLQDTIDNEADKPGGIKNWDGKGVGAAATHAGISALIGLSGIESRVLRKFGNFTGSEFVKGVAGEAIEEGLQYVSERTTRRVDNALRDEHINEMSAIEELKNLGFNMAMGAMGGAVVGGIAVASNRTRAREVVQETFGLNKVEADKVVDEYMGEIAERIVKNANAIADVQNPESATAKEIRAVVNDIVPAEGVDTSKQERIAARARDIIIERQQEQEQQMSDAPALSSDVSIRQPAIESAVEQARAEISVLENAENTAREELNALEEKNVSPLREDVHAQEIAEKQAEIDTIREMAGQEPEFNVSENVSLEAITELQNKLKSDIIQAVEENSPDPDVSVGATLDKYDNRFDTGKERVSAFTQRISKETGKEATKTYRQRDTSAVKSAADTLVANDEARAVRFLRDNTKLQLDGLSKPEILEALYRKHKGNAEESAKLEDFSFIATQFGQGVQAFAEKSPWDASARIRDINNQIVKEAPKKVRQKVEAEKESLKKALKIKQNRLPSNKEIERMTRELLGCK